MTAQAHLGRRAVGIWAQWPEGARWANEGMTRLLGFLIEGIARSDDYVFRVVLPDHIRDAAEEDLRMLTAQIGSDFTLHSPRDVPAAKGSPPSLEQFANENVPVEAWLSLFPYFVSAANLEAPVTVVFPDAIPKVFHEFGNSIWDEEGAHFRWECNVRELLSHASGAIVFSDHVARDQLGRLFGFDPDKITVVRHAAPDIAGQLPMMDRRLRSPDSLSSAAALLRAECASRGDNYLREFPFEEATFIAVSTQDRVTKNLALIARALNILVRERRHNLKLLMTAPLHKSEKWAVLAPIIDEMQCQLDAVSLPDLPRREHAALLHCAALVVHPSLFEGGHAPFPFYEAVSVGTPCVMAHGPHTQELSRSQPDILKYCFDPNGADDLADLVEDILSRREAVMEDQRAIYARLQKANWASVARDYADVALRNACVQRVGACS